VPARNVASFTSDLPWETLAAIPESYGTAWTCLFGNLALKAGQTILIRGATSALGQAAVNIAAHHGARVIATTRDEGRFQSLRDLGAAEVMIHAADLQTQVRARHAGGIDAVLDLVGNSTILDSLAMLRRDGRACLAGFLGGGGPLTSLEPVFQMPSGRHLSVLATALASGSDEFPLSEIPFQDIVDRVAQGVYQAGPAQVFPLDQLAEAHRLLESGQANGKVVVRVHD
jgi:NADPH2:quinone reductase